MFFSIQFPLNYPIIAPLYANVDTSGHGHIYYRETQDPDLLKRFNHRVQHFYPNLQAPFTAKSLFIASWLEVGYFPSGTDKVNTFQAVIGSDGSESFVELLYRPGGVQWVQGRGSSDRLPDARAQAGFVAEDGRLYTLRGSGTDQIQNLDRYIYSLNLPPVRGGITRTISFVSLWKKGGLPLIQPLPVQTGSGSHISSCLGLKILQHNWSPILRSQLVPLAGISHPELTPPGGGVQYVLQRYHSNLNSIFRIYRKGIELAMCLFINNAFLDSPEICDAVDIVVPVRTRCGIYLVETIMPDSKEKSSSCSPKNVDMWSNTDEPGVWLFRVGNTGSSGNVEPPQADNGESENLIDDSSCQTGAMSCHSKAQCIDQDEGYCCVCQAGYYGNGRTCLQDQIPLRVNGKVSVSLNGVTEQEVDVQAYIVTADGRCYTALSRVPPAAGTDAQLISSTADIIGWLFAKSINNAPNGYMLTGGVLNHTAFLTFNNGQHRTTVEQRFLGLDVFDQLRMEGRIFGTVPQVPHGSKLSLPDSQVQFRKISQGVVRSQSSYVVHVDNSLDEYPVTVEQTISFTEHCSTSTSESTFRLKSARTFISYEETENILRFASTNKVSSMTDNDDPCVVGQVSCVNNSHCIPEGSTFKCVCNNGFQTLYTDEATGDYGCVDINECQSGSHSCDNNALCINEVGSFSCQCRQGYTGNGYSCQEVPQDCSSISCSPGAECIESAENGPRCYCIPGFVGDGTTCTPNAEDDCLMCSPHAWCNRTTSGAVQCTCLDGYHGNGRECTQSEDTVIRTCLLGVCWCPSGFVENGQICVKDESASTSTPDTTVSSNSQETDFSQHPEPECFSQSQCFCPRGFTLSGDVCLPEAGANVHSHFTKGFSGNPLSCNTINNCHPQAQCVFVEAQEAYECQCNAGFEGDGLQCSQIESCNIINNCHAQAQCIYVGARDAYECQCNAGFEGDGFNCFEIEMSCLDSDICHLYAECVVEEGSEKGICICDEGYQGDGMTCYRTDMCTEDIECGDNAACLWSDDTQRKECDCDPGYVMDYKICIKQGCEECHEDAECVTNPATGLPQCVCRSGLVGDGIEECVEQPLGCNVLANCAPEANCVYVSPDAGHRCQCRTGYEGNGFECIRVVNCLNDRSLCDPNAQCEVTAGSTYQCVCRTGFVGNGQSCREVRKTEGGYLLVNKGMATVRVPLEPTRTDPGRPIQLQYDQITIGLAVDCVEGLIYWSDITGQVIKSSSLSGKDITNFVEDDINSPEGLAVDWIGRKLFWTDSGKDVIRAADLDIGETETIVSSGLVNPRGIAVHPTRR
ncbi:cell-matrix adhesion [Homalodisca vitripennis]|nr:cell-matrix adhesion [Homalodisca vitripennis]